MNSRLLCCLMLWLAVLGTGCGRISSPPNRPSIGPPKYGRTEAENAVIVVLAKQLGKNPGEINTWRSLKDLGADELDLVEAVMELEEALRVSITDETLDKASGSSKQEDLLTSLTVEKLAAVVAEARRAANAAPKRGRPPAPEGEKPGAKQAVPVSSGSPRIEDIAKGVWSNARQAMTRRMAIGSISTSRNGRRSSAVRFGPAYNVMGVRRSGIMFLVNGPSADNGPSGGSR
jgi:acyl carrier protein